MLNITTEMGIKSENKVNVLMPENKVDTESFAIELDKQVASNTVASESDSTQLVAEKSVAEAGKIEHELELVLENIAEIVNNIQQISGSDESILADIQHYLQTLKEVITQGQYQQIDAESGEIQVDIDNLLIATYDTLPHEVTARLAKLNDTQKQQLTGLTELILGDDAIEKVAYFTSNLPKVLSANSLTGGHSAIVHEELAQEEPNVLYEKSDKKQSKSVIQPFLNEASEIPEPKSKTTILTRDTILERLNGTIALTKGDVLESSANKLSDDLKTLPQIRQAAPSAIAQLEGGKVKQSLDVLPNIQSQAWGRVFASRVVWMANEQIQQASLSLNPKSLGPVEIKLNIQNDISSISFIAPQLTTREALEQALPRLRESFNDNGLTLLDVDISDKDEHEANEKEFGGDTAQGTAKQSEELADDEDDKRIVASKIEIKNSSSINVFA